MAHVFKTKIPIKWKLNLIGLVLLLGIVLGISLLSKNNYNEIPTIAQNISIDSIIIEENAYAALYYPVTEVSEINEMIKTYIDSQLTDFMEEVEGNTTVKDEFYLNFEIYRYSESIVSFVFDQYLIRAGDANGRSYYHTMTFDLEAGRKIELKDIFTIEDYLEYLSEQAYNHLSKLGDYENELELELLRLGTLPDAENFQHFALNKKGLTIFFDEYQIGSGSNPTSQYFMSWEQLSEVTNPELNEKNLSSLDEPSMEEPPVEEPFVNEPSEAESPSVDLKLANKKLIALTFDDGPHPTLTPELLDVLEKHQVLATFFMVGSRIEYYPEIVYRAFSEGHQIGNHTMNHKNLSKLSREALRKEIEETDQQIQEIIGSPPTVLRPPYGSYSDEVLEYVSVPIIMWSVDSEDWKYLDANLVYNQVVQQAKNGDIVLLHDIHKTTIDAIEPIIETLKADGFTFVTMEQLIELRGELNNGKLYYQLPKL